MILEYFSQHSHGHRDAPHAANDGYHDEGLHVHVVYLIQALLNGINNKLNILHKTIHFRNVTLCNMHIAMYNIYRRG